MEKSNIDRIEKSIELNAPQSRVWKALTDYKQFGAWFKVNMETPFIPGKISRGVNQHPSCEGMIQEFDIVELKPEHYFSYRWRPYPKDPNADYSKEKPTLVEFTLETKGAKTLLHVVESGFDQVSAWRRDEAYRMHTSGWEQQLKNVGDYVASQN